MIDKSYSPEYISSNSKLNEKLPMNEEFKSVSKDDESMIIRYLLDIMKEHDIITKEEYHAVLYKYS